MSEMMNRLPSDMPNEEPEQMFEVPGSRLQELRDKERIADALSSVEHEHQWEVIGVNGPVSKIFMMSQYTNVLLRCTECRWLCALELVGNWTEAQIRGEADASISTTTDQAQATNGDAATTS